jgi:hypothetical protein
MNTLPQTESGPFAMSPFHDLASIKRDPAARAL